jgi:hypothetical protein
VSDVSALKPDILMKGHKKRSTSFGHAKRGNERPKVIGTSVLANDWQYEHNNNSAMFDDQMLQNKSVVKLLEGVKDVIQKPNDIYRGERGHYTSCVISNTFLSQ